jgi:beta-carotene/zeaxanthin 4-ketolase
MQKRTAQHELQQILLPISFQKRIRSLYVVGMTQSAANRQSLIGLSLATAMFTLWLGTHFWAMFAFQITAETWLLVPFIFALQCWLSVGMFIVAHDAMHGSLSPGNPRINAVVGAVVLSLYAGFGWATMRNAHFEHHKAVGTVGDPDFNADNPRDFWPWYRVFLKRYFGWKSMVFVWSVVLSYFLLLDVPPANIALLFGFPAIASSLQLFYFGTYRPHRHLGGAKGGAGNHMGGFADHHNSRTNDYGTLASLFSCFHFGYHHEHHLSPATPWWALPARHKEYINDCG